MNSRYIFIHKNKNKKKIIDNSLNIKALNSEDFIDPVRKMMNNIFKESQDNKFIIEIDEVEYEFKYKRIKSKEGWYSFEVISDYLPDEDINARVLDEIYKIIYKGEHRKDYDIILSYSGSAEYYCNKLYKLINAVERKIRNLIYLIATESYGKDWVNQTFDKKITDGILSRKVPRNKLIELILYEMTISELEDYLFLKRRLVDAETFLNEDLNKDKLQNLKKEDIIAKIENNKEKSNWERIFKDKIPINNIEQTLISLRKCRNIVAHSKLISYADFYRDQELITKFNKDLDKAYDLINNDKLNILSSIKIPTTLSSEQLKRAIKLVNENVNLGYFNILKALENIDFSEIAERLKSNRYI